MKILRDGEPPDYRFTLANERTFLAWIRTALGFIAAGVALEQLSPDITTPLIRQGLLLSLVMAGGLLAWQGYFRWLENEKSMRLKQPLRYTPAMRVISTFMVLMSAGCLVALFNG